MLTIILPSQPQLFVISRYLSRCVRWTTNWTRLLLLSHLLQSRRRYMYDFLKLSVHNILTGILTLGNHQELYHCSSSFPEAGCLHRQCSPWPCDGMISYTMGSIFEVWCLGVGPPHAGSTSSPTQFQSGSLCRKGSQRGDKSWACSSSLEAQENGTCPSQSYHTLWPISFLDQGMYQG